MAVVEGTTFPAISSSPCLRLASSYALLASDRKKGEAGVVQTTPDSSSSWWEVTQRPSKVYYRRKIYNQETFYSKERAKGTTHRHRFKKVLNIGNPRPE